MKTRNAIGMALITSLMLMMQLPAQQKTQAIQIAPQVASVMDAGMPLKQGRSDIPMTYLKTLYLPAQQNQLYPVFLFQLKNADLDFAAASDNPALLKSNHLMFTRVYRMAEGAAPEIIRERNTRLALEEAQPTFQPEALNYYSIAGDIFPAGNYLLVLALSTPDYAKISVTYVAFTLPDFSQLKDQAGHDPDLFGHFPADAARR